MQGKNCRWSHTTGFNMWKPKTILTVAKDLSLNLQGSVVRTILYVPFETGWELSEQRFKLRKWKLVLTIDGGNLVSGSDLKKVGISPSHIDMMDEGTRLNDRTISAELDKLGSSISVNARKRKYNCSCGGVLAKISMQPWNYWKKNFFTRVFEADDFKLWKTNHWSDFHRKKLC